MPQGRFRFVDWFGVLRGLSDTDNLQEAIKTANDFQCEILDTKNDNMTVYNCWSVAVKKSGQKNYHVGGRDFSK